MPSFNKQDRSRRSSEDSADSHQAPTMQGNIEECPRTHLDDQRYEESVYYLQEYSRQDLMQFMFQHCHYSDACSLFFPPDGLPPPPLPSPYQTQVPPSSPQRPDPLATEYGSLDELCDLCVGYTAVPALERVIASRIIESSNPDSPVAQHTAAALTRICTYFENHRHFNHLYRFQVLKKDYVAAGLCCIQLFLNSSHQDQALGHLERAKVWKPFFWNSKHGNGCSDSKPKLKILCFFYCSKEQ
jgi:zinc finger FYVE domain-containing protein 26